MYFITTIEHLPEDKYKSVGCTRCVGYYESFEKANEAVIYNHFDIWETIYDYCVIEKIDAGLYQYAFDNDRRFYKFNLETRKYDPIDTPKEFESVVGLSIG